MSTAAVNYTEVRTDTKTRTHTFRSWLASVPTLVVIGSVLTIVLTVGGGLLIWGSNFAAATWSTTSSRHSTSCSHPGIRRAERQGVPRTAAIRRPDGRQRTEGEGVRQPVHRHAPQGHRWRQDVLRAQRGIAGQPDRHEARRGQCRPCSAVIYPPAPAALRLGLVGRRWDRDWVGIASLLGAFVIMLGLAMGYMVHRRNEARGCRNRGGLTETATPPAEVGPRATGALPPEHFGARGPARP